MPLQQAFVRKDGPDAPRETTGPSAGATWQDLVARAATHELYAARQADMAGMAGCAAMLGQKLAQGRPLLWVRHDALKAEAGEPYASGFSELGLDPAQMMLLRARDAPSALQAGLEGARCSGLGAVIIELWGETRAYDLTASRRLALAAKASGTPVFILRTTARPQPSAAETRWLVQAAPSVALAANAPGNPCFALTLLRTRNGQEGLHCHLEWNRDARTFLAREAARPMAGIPRRAIPAALPCRLVSLSLDRPGPPLGEKEPSSRLG